MGGVWWGSQGALRFTLGFYLLVPIVEVLLRRRARGGVLLLAGALPAVVCLGISDWVAWGQPFHSVIEHVRYNYFEGGASDHGTSPWDFYLAVATWERMGPLALAFLVLLGAGLRRTWMLLNAAVVQAAILSTVAHKEERFVMFGWPLLLAAGAVGADVLGRVAARGKAARAGILAVVILFVALGSNFAGAARLDRTWYRGTFAAQNFVAGQPDASGPLLPDRQHHNGGHIVFDRTVPQLPFSTASLQQPHFNYAAVRSTSTSAER